MRRIAVRLKYDGTDFNGFQAQKNGVTIQQTVQAALEEVFGHEASVTGCGRTDAGVHAKNYYILTGTTGSIPAERLPLALNTHLPRSIAATGACEVDAGFHPRYSAQWKEYEYHVWASRFKNPFLDKYSFHHPARLDRELLKKSAALFCGKRDFSGFMSSGSTVENTVRTVFDCTVGERGDELIITIKADGFLYNMARIIAGTLLSAASGLIDAEKLPDIIASCDRRRAGYTAPPQGLFLTRVFYGKDFSL